MSTESGDPGAAATILGGLRRHPVITSVMVGCTLLGAALGVLYLTEDWSLARRLAAGAVGGAGVGFLCTATKLIG